MKEGKGQMVGLTNIFSARRNTMTYFKGNSFFSGVSLFYFREIGFFPLQMLKFYQMMTNRILMIKFQFVFLL
jgi:hypothetical protein